MARSRRPSRSEEHTSELQSRRELVCRLLLEKKKDNAAHALLGQREVVEIEGKQTQLAILKPNSMQYSFVDNCFVSYHLHFCYVFFFNDTATTEIYTLSLHDALPISGRGFARHAIRVEQQALQRLFQAGDRKSTRLNSSHVEISYAVFCLKKKKK